MRYAASLLAGAATSLTLIVLSLRFYVSIERPYLIAASVLLVVLAISWATRNAKRGNADIAKTAGALLGVSAMFAIGAAGAFYGLMAIYPPNLD